MDKIFNELEIKKCEWEEIFPFVKQYLETYTITVESFWEDHVLESNHYKIRSGNQIIGYFSIHKESTIMLFNVFPEYANFSQEIFTQVKKYEKVKKAMVATGDEFFISHCLDNFERIEKQAYFSIYTDKEISKSSLKPISLRLANVNDAEDSKNFKLSGDFLNEEIDKIRDGFEGLEVYFAEHEGEIIGFGVIQYGKILESTASIGMYVREEYRRQGFATSILQGLKNIAENKGLCALSGCWYYNHNSKKTMERAGAYSKTRLIMFYF